MKTCCHQGCSEPTEFSCTDCKQSFCSLHIEIREMYGDIGVTEQRLCGNCAVTYWQFTVKAAFVFLILLLVIVGMYPA